MSAIEKKGADFQLIATFLDPTNKDYAMKALASISSLHVDDISIAIFAARVFKHSLDKRKYQSYS
jgi:hypothetical protein